MIERKRQARHYHSVPGGEEDGVDVELGEETGHGTGSGTGSGSTTIAPSLEEEVDHWDENAEDHWDEDDGAAGRAQQTTKPVEGEQATDRIVSPKGRAE